MKEDYGVYSARYAKKVVFDLFEESHEQAKRNICTFVIVVKEQASVKAFFTGGADKIVTDKMYRLAEFQDVTQNIVPHLIKCQL